MPAAGPGWDVHTIVQFDHRGDIVLQHRCPDKWKFDGNRFNDSEAIPDGDFAKKISE